MKDVIINNLSLCVYNAINEAFDFNAEVLNDSESIINISKSTLKDMYIVANIDFNVLCEAYLNLANTINNPKLKEKDILNDWQILSNTVNHIKQQLIDNKLWDYTDVMDLFLLILCKHKFKGYGLASKVSHLLEDDSNIPWMSGYPLYNPDYKPDNIELDLTKISVNLKSHIYKECEVINIPLNIYVIWILYYLNYTYDKKCAGKLIAFATQLPIIGIISVYFADLLDKWKNYKFIPTSIRIQARLIDDNNIINIYNGQKNSY